MTGVQTCARPISAAEEDPVGVGCLEAGDETEPSVRAAAAGPKEGKELAAVHGERDAVHGPDATEGLGDVLELQEGTQSTPAGGRNNRMARL